MFARAPTLANCRLDSPRRLGPGSSTTPLKAKGMRNVGAIEVLNALNKGRVRECPDLC